MSLLRRRPPHVGPPSRAPTRPPSPSAARSRKRHRSLMTAAAASCFVGAAALCAASYRAGRLRGRAEKGDGTVVVVAPPSSSRAEEKDGGFGFGFGSNASVDGLRRDEENVADEAAAAASGEDSSERPLRLRPRLDDGGSESLCAALEATTTSRRTSSEGTDENRRKYGPLDPCLVDANDEYIRSKVDEWYGHTAKADTAVPLLTSVVISPPSSRSRGGKGEGKGDNGEDDEVSTTGAGLRYAVIFNVKRPSDWQRNVMKKWSDPRRTVWYCDGMEGTIAGDGRYHPESHSIVIECPRRIVATGVDDLLSEVYAVPAGETADPVGNATARLARYNVSGLVRCAEAERCDKGAGDGNGGGEGGGRSQLRRRRRASGPNAVASCVLLRGHNARRRFPEFVAYHRLIGVERFYAYLHEPYDHSAMLDQLPGASADPNADIAPDVQYVPFDLYGSRLESLTTKRNGHFYSFLFQQSMQNDCVRRARADGYDWAAMNDADELIRVVVPPSLGNGESGGGKGAETTRQEPELNAFLRPYLESKDNRDIGGIQISHFFYGSEPSKPRDGLMLHHVHRERRPNFAERQKVVIRPQNVDYYSVHVVADGGRVVDADPNTEVHLAHYKRAEGGCLISKGNGTFVKASSEGDVELDESIRDAYRDRVVREMEKMTGATNATKKLA